MPWPDLVNSLFEWGGALFMILNIRRLHHDKVVRGVDWRVTAFFTVWGFWNLYYYPALDQWLSFAATLGIVTGNTIYMGLMIYYIRKEKTG